MKTKETLAIFYKVVSLSNTLTKFSQMVSETRTIYKISLQTGSPYGLFRDLFSNGARSKARGRAREGEPAMVLVLFEHLRSDSERKLLIGQLDLTHVKYYHLRSTVKR